MEVQTRVRRRSNALMRAMLADYLLRQQFVTDPAGVLAEYVDGKPIAAETANAANHLLYAIVSNPGMVAWLRDRVGNSALDVSNKGLASALAAAVGRNGDSAIAAALIRSAASVEGGIEPALGLLRAVILGVRGVGGIAGTEFTPGTGTQATPGTGTLSTPAVQAPQAGTEFTPGTGTQATPGTGTLSTPAVQAPQAGTEFTPGTGTQATPGTGTLSTPAVQAPQAGTEFTPGTGTQATPGTGTLSTPAVQASQAGTEFTPGTGTQATPGTGTLSTPARIRGWFGEFEQIIQELIEVANELRAVGALRETGFGG